MVSTKDEVFYPKTQVVLDHHKHKKKKKEVLIHLQGLSLAEAISEDLAIMKNKPLVTTLGTMHIFKEEVVMSPCYLIRDLLS
jgi:hypothetical protein